MKVLEIKNVHKIYNSSEVKVHAVNGVTLDFEKGEFAAIVGPSGSGKTTLLNMIGGLDKPTEGEIMVDHTNLAGLKSSALIDFRMRNIGFVFQSYNLIPVLTAKENVEFIMSLQKWNKKERDERTFELLKGSGTGGPGKQPALKTLRWSATACGSGPCPGLQAKICVWPMNPLPTWIPNPPRPCLKSWSNSTRKRASPLSSPPMMPG